MQNAPKLKDRHKRQRLEFENYSPLVMTNSSIWRDPVYFSKQNFGEGFVII